LPALLAIGALALEVVLVVAGAELFFHGLLAPAAYLRQSRRSCLGLLAWAAAAPLHEKPCSR
jgi:hypothetical protein